jgi:hypothetical protein
MTFFSLCNKEQNRGTQDERCTCPDPNKALENNNAIWKSHHDNLVHFAQHAPEDLDVVFFGDGPIEQLSGTLELGTKGATGMEEYFEKRFTKNGGGQLNAIALGSSGDTVCSILKSSWFQSMKYPAHYFVSRLFSFVKSKRVPIFFGTGKMA